MKSETIIRPSTVIQSKSFSDGLSVEEPVSNLLLLRAALKRAVRHMISQLNVTNRLPTCPQRPGVASAEPPPSKEG